MQGKTAAKKLYESTTDEGGESRQNGRIETVKVENDYFSATNRAATNDCLTIGSCGLACFVIP